MKPVVIDTDIFIDYFRKFEKSVKFFEDVRNKDYLIYFSAVSETELVSGEECNRAEVKSKLLNFLSNFNKVFIDNQIAVRAGDFRRLHNIKMPDALIAATAFIMKADLITRNVNDFKDIKEITIKIPY
mgnify:FL=1